MYSFYNFPKKIGNWNYIAKRLFVDSKAVENFNTDIYEFKNC